MFTGIAEHSVPVVKVQDHEGGRRLTLGVRWGDEKHGESLAVNGCCLTVAAIGEETLEFDVIRQTLSQTNLGHLNEGDRVHVERSLRAGDRLDGHFVLGHVDGLAVLASRMDNHQEHRLRLRVNEPLARYVLDRGSVCLDGVSLTVAAVDGPEFEVALIPSTLEKTLLGERPVGWPMNFEADILVKGVVLTLERIGIDPSGNRI